jgi:hypothetical protein
MGLLAGLSSGKQRRSQRAFLDDSSKLGSQRGLEIQQFNRIGKRFPDEVYHTQGARQYAPDLVPARSSAASSFWVGS